MRITIVGSACAAVFCVAAIGAYTLNVRSADAYLQSYYEGYYYAQGYYYGQGYYYAQGYYQGYYYNQAYYYNQGYYQGGYAITFTDSVSVAGNLSVTGALGKGSGSFVIDHPLDPENKLLYHSFLESPDAKNIYDGVAVLDGKGEAVVVLPTYFEALNGDYRYQLKPIGKSMPNLHVKEEVKDNRFSIAGGEAGGKISWQVTGNRHDAYMVANPIIPEVMKGPDAPVGKGEYLLTEAYGPNAFHSALAMLSDVMRPVTDVFNAFVKPLIGKE